MGYTRQTELRKISPAELSKIAFILSQSGWKKLMEYVPLRLTDAENWIVGSHRYKIDDIALIENTKQHKMPSEIFLEEWATSGVIRPTLGHLLQFLVNIELFRAADYVATLLSEDPPTRPSSGPAARVDIDLALQELNSNEYTNMMNVNTGDSKRNLDEVVKVDDFVISRGITRENHSTVSGRSHIPSTAAERNQPSTSAAFNQLPRQNHFLPVSEGSNSPDFLPKFEDLISNPARTHQPDVNPISMSYSQLDTKNGPNLSMLRQNQSYSLLPPERTDESTDDASDATSSSSYTISSNNYDSGDSSHDPNLSSQLDSKNGPNLSMLRQINQSHLLVSSERNNESNNFDSGDSSYHPNLSQLNVGNDEENFSANIPQLSALRIEKD